MADRAHWHEFADKAQLAEALADAVAAGLTEALQDRQGALLAVSGGTTPGTFLATLSRRQIAWDRVTVTLVDERQVPPTSARSNERLVREGLLQGPAAAATFRRLVATDRPEIPDIVVLGMGTDGHTASIFADAPNLRQLLDSTMSAVVEVAEAEGREARITMNLALIARARHLFVHIEGPEKKALLSGWLDGSAGPRPPVRSVIDHATAPAAIYWAP